MASTTLNYTAQVGQEIAEAVGWADNLGGAATEAQAKAHIARYLKDLVRSHKDTKRKAELAPITDIVIT